MTSPLESYTAALDALAYPKGAKERMVANLRAAAEKNAPAEKDMAAEVGGASEKNVLADVVPLPRRTRRRPWVRVAAGLAIALVLGGGGTVAVAAGVLPNPANVLSDLFGGAPAQTELLDSVGRPVGASCTSNGVTVTATAVIGDRSNYTVVFTVERADGEAIEGITSRDDGTLILSDATLRVDGTMSASGSSRFYDADPADNAIQLAFTLGATTWDGSSVLGRTARFSMSELSTFSAAGETEVVATGDWDLKFEMNYVDTTVELPAGQETTWQGADVRIDAVEVSSVGVTVEYTIWRQMGDLGPSGQMGDEARAEQDAVIGLPVTVRFSDGTTFDAPSANSTAVKQDDGTTKVTNSVTYDRIVDGADVVGVTVGDVSIDV